MVEFLTSGYSIIGMLILFLVMGMPIAHALGVTATVLILLNPAVMPQILGMVPYQGANNYLLVAALLFLLVGEVMNQGRIADSLLSFASALVGHLKGGLAQVNILTSLLFSEISGSASADAAAIGSIMIPQMVKRGYSKAFAAAVTSTSATMSIIVPPSLNLILYAYVSSTPIAHLFMAGILPGILVCLLLMIASYFQARKYNHPVEHEFSLGRVGRTFKSAILPLTIPVLILGGILAGIFTATEAGAVAGLWAIVISMIIYRSLSWHALYKAIMVSGKRAAMLMFIVATSTLLSWYLTTQQIPQQIAQAILNVSDNYWVVLTLINVFFLLAGTIVQGTPAILMLVPIFLPLADLLGIDRVHFGLLVTINLGIGQQTPPVATVIIITCSIARISIMQILPAMGWFIFAMLIALALVSIFPMISLILPSLMFS